MDKYRSGIIGKARVKFGGAIRIGIHGGVLNDSDKVIAAISLSEVMEPTDVGNEVPESTKDFGQQVWLEFNNLTSIDMMRDALDCLEEYLKTSSFPKANGKYPKTSDDKEG